jgi:hypothetical protein
MEVEHHSEPRYVLNLCALHNANELRSAVPERILKECIPVGIMDRIAHRKQCAVVLRDRRAQTAAEREERACKQLKRSNRPVASQMGSETHQPESTEEAPPNRWLSYADRRHLNPEVEEGEE